jgi:MFS family permease
VAVVSGPNQPDLRNTYWFAAFNALSFQVVLAGPMVLYAKTLGATATVLGIVAGMMPLLTISQIPAANYVNRVGYRRFVVGGWSTRVGFVFAMAAVPLATFLGTGSQLVALLSLLFCFNLSRGISSAAWLPWISSLVPSEMRGRYLARDQAAMNGASLACFLVAAGLFGAGGLLPAPPQPWQFSLLFLFSAAMGAVSLTYLRRIPDVPAPPESSPGAAAVPWREILSYPPFKSLLRVNAAWSLAYGGLTTFVVSFLKSGTDLAEGPIMVLMAAQFVGGLGAVWFGGPRLDRLGSKPAMGVTMLIGCCLAAGWLAIAGKVWAPGLGVIALLIVPLGLLNALFSASNNRLAMLIVPTMGRNHFFAAFSVVWQFTLGLSPVLWGLVIDLVGSRTLRLGALEWNRYSVFFGLVVLAFGFAFALVGRLVESRAASVETLLHELFVEEPHRAVTRWLGRG